jgi:hypothetical protein
MLKRKFLAIVLAVGAMPLTAHTAAAQATRTWVSGLGNDADPCSRTAPCKTFAGAISKTAAGGEINALDPGGFGALTITKSLTIDGGGGQVASVLVAGTNGIVINGSSSTVVTLRNLRINGLAGTPTPGLNGIHVLGAGTVHIENCVVFGFSQNALNIAVNTASPARVIVTASSFSNSAGGVIARNSGAGNLFLSLERVSSAGNSGFGVKADGSVGSGSIFTVVSDGMVSSNGTGVWALGGSSAFTGMQVIRSSIVNNVTTGVLSDGTTGQSSLLLSNTLVSGNGTGLSHVGANGNLFTYKSNSVNQNVGADGTFSSQITPE